MFWNNAFKMNSTMMWQRKHKLASSAVQILVHSILYRFVFFLKMPYIYIFELWMSSYNGFFFLISTMLMVTFYLNNKWFLGVGDHKMWSKSIPLGTRDSTYLSINIFCNYPTLNLICHLQLDMTKNHEDRNLFMINVICFLFYIIR